MPEAGKPDGCVLCFDFGTRQIGVAIGQTVTGTASPLGVIKNHRQTINWDAITQAINEWKPSLLIVGLPLNMDGSKSDFCAQAERFSRQLNGRYGVPVELADERLSTFEAKSREASTGRHRKAGYASDPVDSLAAHCILESWLSTLNRP
ncbi:MAG: Holliday junction resolvase RuvX [Pseudomonadales bacterium]|nr:Holliday junction resolvase RuvX [Pseudomonadales bacterium]